MVHMNILTEAWGPTHNEEQLGGGRHPPASPVSPSGFQPWWWNMTTLAKPTMLATSRQTQPKVQHIVPTTTDNITRVIQAAIES